MPLLHSKRTPMKIEWIEAAAIAYVLGSIPFGYLLVLLFRKEDIRQTGSGNIGATNVIRSGSRWLGILTLLLDLGNDRHHLANRVRADVDCHHPHSIPRS